MKSRFTVMYNGKTVKCFARTPEGAVKKAFAELKMPIPRPDMTDWSWKGVSVEVDNLKRVDPYKLPKFTWKYDQETKQWVKA